jgi:putative intracellular protease/amidase
VSKPSFEIVFVLFEGVTQLDFTGPHQVLSRVPGAAIRVASVAGTPITADGLVFASLSRLADVERCDVLIVPGGFGTTAAMGDPALLGEIRRLAAGAGFVTSVCTGSLLLAAAGLLEGRRAACHWASRDLLALFGAIPDPGRVVCDGHLITGGGVTAGIDFALTLAAELAGPETAQAIQLSLEYAAAPPFRSGRPETAPAEVLARVEKATARTWPERLAAATAAAARL